MKFGKIKMENKIEEFERFQKMKIRDRIDSISGKLYWVRSNTKRIQEQIDNYKEKGTLPSFNSFGVFQSSAVSVDVAIAELCGMLETMQNFEAFKK